MNIRIPFRKRNYFGTDFERFIYNKYPELKKIKEKEKEENKLDLEKKIMMIMRIMKIKKSS